MHRKPRPFKIKISKAKLYRMYHTQGMTYAEIAKELGVSTSTVRDRILLYDILIIPRKSKHRKGTKSSELLERIELRKKSLTETLLPKDSRFLPTGQITGIKNPSKEFTIGFYKFPHIITKSRRIAHGFTSHRMIGEEYFWPAIKHDINKAIVRKSKEQKYWIEVFYMPKKGDKDSSPNLPDTEKMREFLRNRHPNGMSFAIPSLDSLRSYSITFIELIRSSINIFAESQGVASELKGLFKEMRESGTFFLFEDEEEIGIELLDKDTLGALGLDVPIYKEAPRTPAPSLVPIKYSKSFIDARFISRDKIVQQLNLFPDSIRGNISASIEGGQEGIDLTATEDRTLSAILAKFTKHDYEFNSLPFTKSELYLLAGMEKKLTKRGKYEYSAWESKRIEQALEALGKKHYPIIYKKVTGYDKKKKGAIYDVARTHSPLIQVVGIYKDVPARLIEEETGDIDKKLSKHFDYWRINIHAVLVAPGNYFRTIPGDFYSRLNEAKRLMTDTKGRVKLAKIETSFIQWLNKHYRREVSINYLMLARQLKLAYYIDNRMLRKLREKITDLYALYKNAGFLLDYEIGTAGAVDTLHLNPKEFYHLRKTAKTKKVE